MVSASVIALALTTSACTSQSPEDVVEPTQSAKTAGRGQTPLRSADAVLADGTSSHLHVVGKIDARVAENVEALPFALTPDGVIVAGIKRRDPDNPLRLVRNRLALIDPRSGQVKYVSTQAQSDGVQVTAAASTRHWVTWITTTSTTMGSNPWTLYSYNRRTDRTYRLGSAPTLPNGKAPMTSDFSYPSIASGRVYLTGASREQDRNTIATSVYSVALDGRGVLREDFRHEEYPIASGNTIVALRQDGANTVQIVQHSAGPRGTTTDIATALPTEGAAHKGKAVAWPQKRHGRHVLMLKVGASEPQAVFESRRPVVDLVLTSKYLQFEVGSTAYWYDRDSEALLKLDERGVYLPPNGHGNYVVWKTDSPRYGKPGGEIVVARLDSE